MAVTTTNLGVITAYGDAVAAGYTGTKAEWQALMASYATVGQQAVAAKDTAVAAKDTAVAKATEATTAASTATTKASEASASAQSIAQSAAQIQENTDSIDQLKSDLDENVNDIKNVLTSVDNDITSTLNNVDVGRFIGKDTLNLYDTIFDGYQFRTIVGQNISVAETVPSSTIKNYIIDITGYDKIKIYQYRTTAGYGSAITDANNIVLSRILNTEDGYLTVDVPENAKYLFAAIHQNATYPAVELIKSPDIDDKISTINYNIENIKDIVFGKPIIITADDLWIYDTIFDGYQFKPVTGTNISTSDTTASATIKNYLIDISGIEYIIIDQYGSTSLYGSAFIDDSNIVVGTIINSSHSYLTVEVPKNATKLVASLVPTYPVDYLVKMFPVKNQGSAEWVRLGLHKKPINDGVLNAIKNARQITDIVWTPIADLPRTSIVDNGIYNAPHHEYFEDVFNAGVKYTGVPYTDVTNKKRLVGTDIKFETFMSAINNPNSIEYEESAYQQSGASYYGCSCTMLTAYAFNLPYTYSNYVPSIEGMTLAFKLINNGIRHTLSDLMLCDILQINGHCAMISDIITDENDDVVYVEVAEQTRLGNSNKLVQGSAYGGKARRVMFSSEEFYTYYSDFNVYRYGNLGNVKYVESSYVSMEGEGKRVVVPFYPVMPYRGDCFVQTERSVKLILNAAGYTHIIVTKNGVNWNENGTTDPYVIPSGNEIIITCDDEEALYTAKLVTLQNGDIYYETLSCKWHILRGVIISVTTGSGSISFTVKTTLKDFVPWFVNFSDNSTTVYGGNKMVNEYTYSYADDYHQYAFSVSFSGTTPTKYLLGIKSDSFGSCEFSGDI